MAIQVHLPSVRPIMASPRTRCKEPHHLLVRLTPREAIPRTAGNGNTRGISTGAGGE